MILQMLLKVFLTQRLNYQSAYISNYSPGIIQSILYYEALPFMKAALQITCGENVEVEISFKLFEAAYFNLMIVIGEFHSCTEHCIVARDLTCKIRGKAIRFTISAWGNKSISLRTLCVQKSLGTQGLKLALVFKRMSLTSLESRWAEAKAALGLRDFPLLML